MSPPPLDIGEHDAVLTRYREALWRLTAGYARSRQDREDLYQDVALAVWQALPRFRGDCSERTFVYRIAHNRGISHRARTARRNTRPLADLEETPAVTPSPETASIVRDDITRLHVAVRTLPVAYREVVVLRLEGLSSREIAEIVGISENNVDVRLVRARQKLRDEMGEAGNHE
ncbi:MAG: sigma-70 family RNA polymerase sigma factor [Acidobacteria bacterium]|nr:sigma-70 family RNA polymerase sigma factor [Acidobacteriota bacterium]